MSAMVDIALVRQMLLNDPPSCVAELLVSSDVWEALQRVDAPASGPPAGAWRITTASWLAPGTVIPLDANGQPIPRPLPKKDKP